MRSYTSITLTLVLLLTGCGVMPAMPGADGGLAPSVNRTDATPTQAAESFLTAWNSQNREAMYRLISARSQAITTYETFDRVYTTLNNDVGGKTLNFTLGEVRMQGTSAALTYDLALETELFGTIEDAGRTMRLVQENGVWRVAWSTMDIFDGYTADASLSVDSDAQRRANIYDRNGVSVVQEGGTVSMLYVQQSLMNEVVDCANLLADLLYEPVAEVLQSWNTFNLDTIFYVGEVDEAVEIEYRDQLQATCGMSRDNRLIAPRRTRQYIGQGGVVHVTGYIGQIPQEPESEKNKWLARGYDESALIGRAGVELEYEAILAGQPPRVLRITEPGGTVLRELGRTEGVPPQPVYLTIDHELQIETARAVAWGYNYAANNWAEPGRSDGGGAVVMDVNTGEILAMTSFPTFAPGLFNPDNPAPNRGDLLAEVVNDPREPLSVRPTQKSYAPGSIYKVITTAAVLNEQLTDPNNIFDCRLTWDGSQTYGDTSSPRADWRLTDGLDATGEIVPSQALTSSCDPFYYEFGARMFRDVSPDVLVNYSRQFGLGRPTGIGIYPEVAGTLPVPGSVDEAINNAIGQGDMQITMLQAAMMTAAVANGGTLYQPYIVQQIGGGENAQQVGQPKALGTLDYAPGVLEEVQRGMCGVVMDDDKGTAWWVFYDLDTFPNYQACGKTGTAQTVREPHAWFVAYAPADDPEIAVVAMAQHSREGSQVPAPMVRVILDQYFDSPVASYPLWWTEEYLPLEVPSLEGVEIGS
jgi:penicillin-binding protein 2